MLLYLARRFTRRVFFHQNLLQNYLIYLFGILYSLPVPMLSVGLLHSPKDTLRSVFDIPSTCPACLTSTPIGEQESKIFNPTFHVEFCLAPTPAVRVHTIIFSPTDLFCRFFSPKIYCRSFCRHRHDTENPTKKCRMQYSTRQSLSPQVVSGVPSHNQLPFTNYQKRGLYRLIRHRPRINAIPLPYRLSAYAALELDNWCRMRQRRLVNTSNH